VIRHLRTVPLGIVLLGACTPVGAWVYEDPSFSIRDAVLQHGQDPGGVSSDSLQLRFSSCNLNDYDLLGEAFDAQLLLGGRPAGNGQREQPYFLHNRDTSGVTITLALDSGWLARIPAGKSRFEVVGNLLIKSPIGDRHVALRERGNLVRDDTGLVIHSEAPRMCRPGLSRLPAEFEPRVQLDPNDRPPPPPPRTRGNP
jgi:hypothetical protein